MVKRALISVSDRTGIIPLARALEAMGVEIVSTLGTLEALKEAGIKAVPVSDVTGYSEFLDGRIKTLHPAIHAAIMAERDNPAHIKMLESYNIIPIDMVVTNLYPFKDTVLKGNVDISAAIEKIDIGGSALIRASALNYKNVLIIVDPEDYSPIMDELKNTHAVSIRTRYKLAYKAFAHTSHYDALISRYLKSKIGDNSFPDTITLTYEKIQDMRYGENPHQRAAFYREIGTQVGCISDAKKIHGKELSFNNINDASSAIELLKEFDEPTCVIVKQANPCGVGSAKTLLDAYKKAYTADTESAFGGIVAVNREIDEDVAKEISPVFFEVIIAPTFSSKAVEMLSLRKELRLLELDHIEKKQPEGILDFKKVGGGILAQDVNNQLYSHADLEYVTQKEPTEKEFDDMIFALKVAKHTRSNAIVVVKDKKTLGIGKGQSSRVNAARIAIEAAGDNSKGAVMASDAFFPFSDTVEEAANSGISAIIQPGGSKKDKDSIDLCDKYGISMIFTHVRHLSNS